MKKKILSTVALTLAAIALVVATVFTTIAYLTASSAVSNTFTVGNVNIAMYESAVDANGKALPDTELHGHMKDSDGNNYHLLPGTTYDKDPTVYVDKDSDKSFVFLKVRNNIASIEFGNYKHGTEVPMPDDEDHPTIAMQMAAYGWQFYLATPTGDVFVYTGNTDPALAKNGVTNGTLLTGDALQTVLDKKAPAAEVGGIKTELVLNVFDEFTVDKHADVSKFGGAKVTLTAFAIQIAGFVDNPETDANEALDAAWLEIVSTYPYEDGAKENSAE